MTNIDLTEQANTGDLVEQRIERCPVHGTWLLKAQGCGLCRRAFEQAIHPAGSGLVA